MCVDIRDRYVGMNAEIPKAHREQSARQLMIVAPMVPGRGAGDRLATLHPLVGVAESADALA